MSRISVFLICSILFLAACSSQPESTVQPAWPQSTEKYQYQAGLGYGFLGKHVQVSLDGVEVISIVGTEEIETHAQLLGTKVLGGGSTDNQLVTVRVVVDGGAPFEQVIDLEEGGIIHIYYQQDWLDVFNTEVLILE